MSKKEILFIDSACPKPYSPLTLATEGLGGTEATVIRIAEALAEDSGLAVRVGQRGRSYTDPSHKAVYATVKNWYLDHKWHAVVVLRNPEVAINLAKKFNHGVPVYLWLHDLVTNAMGTYSDELAKWNIKVICVSDFHKTSFTEAIRSHRDVKQVPFVRVIYNPISDFLCPTSDAKVDKNKLVFFSSPHKGLLNALNLFKAARNFNPDFRLYVSNPGYFSSSDISAHESVFDLGVLSHGEAIKHVREALCVFYPNYIYPETFGLVFAEANAVGTPVLAHPIGAAREVLNGNFQLVDGRDPKKTLDRLMSWYDTRPLVTGREEFRLKNVLPKWKELLNVR